MPVVLLRDIVPRPVRFLRVGEDDARVFVELVRVAPNVELTLWRAFRGAPRPLKRLYDRREAMYEALASAYRDRESRGEPTGALLHRLRREGLPLGLLYGAYCPPHLHVRRQNVLVELFRLPLDSRQYILRLFSAAH